MVILHDTFVVTLFEASRTRNEFYIIKVHKQYVNCWNRIHEIGDILIAPRFVIVIHSM